VTEPDRSHQLYHESGSSWWPLLWGPVFALAGAGVEALSGPVHGALWVLTGLGLAVCAFVWVSARRRVCSVWLTAAELTQGREALAVAKIAAVEDVGSPVGARVLGGGWSVPKRFAEVPVRLADGSVVLAWAKDPIALKTALRPLLPAAPEAPEAPEAPQVTATPEGPEADADADR
jgi:hypothetical protein